MQKSREPKLICYLAFLLLPHLCQAQSYQFEFITDTYEDLVGATVVSPEEVWDAVEFSVPIGFDFEYFGETVDTLNGQTVSLSVLSNALLLSLDTIGVSPPLLPASNNLTPNFFDVIDRGLVDGAVGASQSTISYLTQGEIGNRIFKMEWKNVGFGGELNTLGSTDFFTNYQLWLYEADSRIEYRYGENSIPDIDIAYDRRSGPTVSIGSGSIFTNNSFSEAFNIVGPAQEPRLLPLQQFEISFQFVLTGAPDDGAVYIFIDRSFVNVVDNTSLSTEYSIYPNPVKNNINVTSNKEAPSINYFTIYSATGQFINKYDGGNTIDVFSLPMGAYSLLIHTDEGVAVKNFIKPE